MFFPILLSLFCWSAQALTYPELDSLLWESLREAGGSSRFFEDENGKRLGVTAIVGTEGVTHAVSKMRKRVTEIHQEIQQEQLRVLAETHIFGTCSGFLLGAATGALGHTLSISLLMGMGGYVYYSGLRLGAYNIESRERGLLPDSKTTALLLFFNYIHRSIGVPGGTLDAVLNAKDGPSYLELRFRWKTFKDGELKPVLLLKNGFSN